VQQPRLDRVPRRHQQLGHADRVAYREPVRVGAQRRHRERGVEGRVGERGRVGTALEQAGDDGGIADLGGVAQERSLRRAAEDAAEVGPTRSTTRSSRPRSAFRISTSCASGSSVSGTGAVRTPATGGGGDGEIRGIDLGRRAELRERVGQRPATVAAPRGGVEAPVCGQG
jgi:hypothetical protein